MAVRDHVTRVSKLRAKVVTVDPAQRLVHAVTPDGAVRQIAVFDVPTAFQWPKEGEEWSIYEENGYWVLGNRYQGVEDEIKVEDLQPGESLLAKMLENALWRTGDIKTTALSAAPAGWLACDGSAVTNAYPALRQALIDSGSPHGSDVNGNPCVPDLRGRSPIGVGTGVGLTPRTLGITGGKESVKLTAAQSGVPAHNHPWSDSGFGVGVNNETNPAGATGHYQRAASGNPIGNNVAQDAAQTHENMPPFVALTYIIKT